MLYPPWGAKGGYRVDGVGSPRGRELLVFLHSHSFTLNDRTGIVHTVRKWYKKDEESDVRRFKVKQDGEGRNSVAMSRDFVR